MGSSPNLRIGDRVTVTSSGKEGIVRSTSFRLIVRFSSKTNFATGIWIGVELEEACGKNDGSVEGVQYFECPFESGIFVRSNQLQLTNALQVIWLDLSIGSDSKQTKLFEEIFEQFDFS